MSETICSCAEYFFILTLFPLFFFDEGQIFNLFRNESVIRFCKCLQTTLIGFFPQ